MKTFLSLMILVACSFVQADDAVIADFGKADDSGKYAAHLSRAQEDKILAQAEPLGFGRDTCTDKQDKILTNPLNVLRGDFTGAGEIQYVVAYASSRCPGSHAGTHGNLVLVDKDMNVLDVNHDLPAVDFHQVMPFPLGNGLEVIVTATDGNQGYMHTMAETVSFEDYRIQRTQEISGQVAESSCGADENGEITVGVFKSSSNGFKAIQRNFKKKCNEPDSAYRFVNEGDIQEN